MPRGASLTARTLQTLGLERVNVITLPRFGAYLQAWLFGAQVAKAVYRQASVELELERPGLGGYHFVELYLGDIYPHPFYDATATQIDSQLWNGLPIRKAVPRFQTLALPHASVRVVGTYGGQPLTAFALDLPSYRSREIVL